MFGSPTERETPDHSGKRVLLEDHHLLKVRVKALMRHRSDHPFESPSYNPVSDHMATTPPVTPSPPRTSVTPPDQEESVANRGFERFLSLLNKGVDLDLLNRIVNDDSEDLHLEDQPLNVQPCGVKGEIDMPIARENLECNDEMLRTERSTCQHSPSKRRSLSDDKNRKDRQERSRSKSPPTVENKKTAEVDERCEQLQNILNTLGLSLEVEEMSKLTDRTQERLYGRRDERRPVATSSSCETSRKSSSRSWSRSPSGRRSSNSRHSMDRHKEKSFSECSDSALSNFCDRDDAQVQTHFAGNNEDGMAFDGTPLVHSHQDGDTFPGYGLPQYSHFNAPFNGHMTSCWAHAQGATSSSVSFPSSSPYSLDTYHFHPTIVSVDSRLSYHHHHHSLEDVFLMNPDLSWREYQFGSSSVLPQFLHPVAKQPVMKPPLRIAKCAWKRRAKKKNIDKKQAEKEKWLRLLEEQGRDVSSLRAPKASTNIIEIKQTSEPPKAVEPSHGQKCPKVELSNEGKRQLTDEEIKANLRKKLEAFNQKNKSHTKPKS
ncbi:uncharacterized protein LOC129182852 isoform X3 [Dunckerocampus dactyliophorus]|nr:uncharacterized protein LOC129182852 isoform X3 [Dunckerocampus dactyliophorus]